MPVLSFLLNSTDGYYTTGVTINQAILAGWTGRDRAAMEHHIVEMEAIGVKRPPSLPVFYRCSASRLNTADEIEVTGEDSSGEVEFVLIQTEGNLWVGTVSDQTDRKVGSYNITVSKQMCDKPLAQELWSYDDIAPNWDQMVLRAWTVTDTGSDALPDCFAIFSGTIPAIGGLRPSQRFEFEFRGSGVRPLATARILDPDAAGHWLNQINKARRVLNAGPEEGQDEEKETNDYSDGTAKLPMKELRLSGLLQVDPRPWPLKSWASA